MFEQTSRYYNIATAEFITTDGRKVAYVRRRFLPQGDQLPLLQELSVTHDDRLDLITAKALGDPEQFWKICDANNVMQPTDLVADPVQRIRIPIPQV
jgi:nucleoid-associated protein YgaU